MHMKEQVNISGHLSLKCIHTCLIRLLGPNEMGHSQTCPSFLLSIVFLLFFLSVSPFLGGQFQWVVIAICHRCSIWRRIGISIWIAIRGHGTSRRGPREGTPHPEARCRAASPRRRRSSSRRGRNHPREGEGGPGGHEVATRRCGLVIEHPGLDARGAPSSAAILSRRRIKPIAHESEALDGWGFPRRAILMGRRDVRGVGRRGLGAHGRRRVRSRGGGRGG